MTDSRENTFVSKQFMKEWGLRFLRSLNADKEEYLNQFRVEHARLVQESLQDRRKTSYTIDDVHEIFKNLQQLVEREISAALVNLSLKGLQHIRAILEHGEEALDYLPTVDFEEVAPPAPAAPSTTSGEPSLPKEWLASVEEKMKQLDERISRAFADLEHRIVQLDQQPQESTDETRVLSRLLSEVQDLSKRLKEEQSRLAGEIKALKDSLPRDDDSKKAEMAIDLMNRQYEDLKNQLQSLQRQIESQLEHREAELEPTEAEGIIREMEEYVSSLPKEMPDTAVVRHAQEDETSQTVVLDVGAVKEFRELLESALVDIRSTLMDPLRARGELDRLEKRLEEAPRAMTSAETSPEYEELRKTIETFKRKLRERDLILEHTRKALSSNPKYAALWILQELGELPLSTLGKSVGVPSVVLRKELREFEEQGLIRFIGADSDPIVQVVFDVPSLNSSSQ